MYLSINNAYNILRVNSDSLIRYYLYETCLLIITKNVVHAISPPCMLAHISLSKMLKNEYKPKAYIQTFTIRKYSTVR